MSSKGHDRVTMPMPRHTCMYCSLCSGVGQGWVPAQLLHEPVGGLHKGFSWSLNPVSSQAKMAQSYLSCKEELRTKTMQKKLPCSGPGPKEGQFRCQFLPDPDG